MARNDGEPLQALETSFRIIEGLKELRGAGVSELARHLDLPKSTVHNHLRSLEEMEYIVREGDTYQNGIRFLGIGEQARFRRKIYDTARPEADKLATETNELSAVMVEEHGWGVFIHRAKSDQAVHIDSYPGQRIHLHSTALGKAILAYLPEHRVEEIIDDHGLPPVTENTITDREALLDELDEIRETRVAYDDEERVQGLRCVASPIRSNEDSVIGAISVAGPTSRIQDGRFEEEIPDQVLSAANVIELNITYS
ncbi:MULTISPECIES: IclR family transcriptional regulator [Halorussus]|uniref:IclR family transcriptional regulator n=1 Tax=Halorussus TaxID=1070314 RepID=UPI00209CC33E|nr:IclR family transcriptional regulator [Halorussus vallis]USZ78359.1 IclR family transcriptional regulator [Halorussus vallis]